jgi:hypothetical protein
LVAEPLVTQSLVTESLVTESLVTEFLVTGSVVTQDHVAESEVTQSQSQLDHSPPQTDRWARPLQPHIEPGWPVTASLRAGADGRYLALHTLEVPTGRLAAIAKGPS